MEQLMNALSRGMKILEEGRCSDKLEFKYWQATNVALRYNYELLHLLLEEN